MLSGFVAPTRFPLCAIMVKFAEEIFAKSDVLSVPRGNTDFDL